MPMASPAFKYAVVTVDYFTKWVEAIPLVLISSKKVQEFIWESIICRFGVSHEIVSDNGTQFDSNEFRNFYDDLGIKKSFSLVDHPQTNGQVETVNKIIKFNLKTKLEEHKGLWAEELPKVLWAYRMTLRTSTQHFKLTTIKPNEEKEEEAERMNSVLYSNVVGSTMYAMVCSGPDYSSSMVSRFMANQEESIDKLLNGCSCT